MVSAECDGRISGKIKEPNKGEQDKSILLLSLLGSFKRFKYSVRY